MKQVDEFTGRIITYDPSIDVDEFIVCSEARQGRLDIGHSCHSDLRCAKIAQLNLYLNHGIAAWIEYIPAFGPPGIEEQLDAEILLTKEEYLQ